MVVIGMEGELEVLDGEGRYRFGGWNYGRTNL
jgi:hypothetical protein